MEARAVTRGKGGVWRQGSNQRDGWVFGSRAVTREEGWVFEG